MILRITVLPSSHALVNTLLTAVALPESIAIKAPSSDKIKRTTFRVSKSSARLSLVVLSNTLKKGSSIISNGGSAVMGRYPSSAQ